MPYNHTKSSRRNTTSKNTDQNQRRLPLVKIWKNNFFALRLIWKAAPLYITYYFISSIVYSVVDFLSGTFLLRLIVNSVQRGFDSKRILIYIFVILSMNLFVNVINAFVSDIILAGSHSKIEAAIHQRMFKQAQQVELSCYENPEFYEKYVRAMEGANGHVLSVMYTLDGLIWRTINLLGNSLLIFTIDPIFIIFALIPLFLGFVKKKNNKLKHQYNVDSNPYKRRKAYIKRTFYLNEYAKELRQTNIYTRLIENLEENLDYFKKVHKRYCFKQAIYSLVIKVGTQIITILGATLYSIYHAIITKKILLGDCLVVISSIGDISSSLENFVSKLAEFHEHALYLEDVQCFLDYKPTISENSNGKKPFGGVLELKNVCFKYDGAEEYALTNINLTINPGERIALVGQNGSGKTTLIKLLLHLYEPTDGTITLNGLDWKEFNLKLWREQFSIVFQDFHNFPFTVAQNVLLCSSCQKDDSDIKKALKSSGILEKILSFDRGVDTVLTREFDDQGAVLSGGESQKIALARAFLQQDRPFVLLDEPSSALDPIAEHEMFENMMSVTEGRSVVFISHRLSSVINADCIYLLEHGKIVESGKHSDLILKNGKYADMFQKQAEKYTTL